MQGAMPPWAESYDRDVADTFALESELAETIVAQLKAKLSPEEKAAIEEDQPLILWRTIFTSRQTFFVPAPLLTSRDQECVEAADLLEKAVAHEIPTTSSVMQASERPRDQST